MRHILPAKSPQIYPEIVYTPYPFIPLQIKFTMWMSFGYWEHWPKIISLLSYPLWDPVQVSKDLSKKRSLLRSLGELRLLNLSSDQKMPLQHFLNLQELFFFFHNIKFPICLHLRTSRNTHFWVQFWVQFCTLFQGLNLGGV